MSVNTSDRGTFILSLTLNISDHNTWFPFKFSLGSEKQIRNSCAKYSKILNNFRAEETFIVRLVAADWSKGYRISDEISAAWGLLWLVDRLAQHAAPNMAKQQHAAPNKDIGSRPRSKMKEIFQHLIDKRIIKAPLASIKTTILTSVNSTSLQEFIPSLNIIKL